MPRGTTAFEVVFSGSGRVEVAPVRRSRRTTLAIVCGLVLAVGPGLFAAVRVREARPDNHGEPVAAAELITVSPGTASGERDTEIVPAAVAGPDGTVLVDLGELEAGSSAGYDDLLRLRNDGAQAMLVYVDASGISEAPMHASLSGDEAPGAFFIEPGAERSVDLAAAADITGTPGDVVGQIVVRSASGYLTETIPARVTVTEPPVDDLIAALLGGTNPNARDDVLGRPNEGLEAPDFVVEGVWDGGAYAADVEVSWRPVGPLTDVHATLDGREVDRTFVAGAEGVHVLHLEGRVLGSATYSEDVSFRIDKTAPRSVLVSSPVTPARNATFLVDADDAGPVAGVDVVLVRQPDPEPSPSPTPTPAPTPTPTPEPSPESSPEPSADPTPTPTATPEPQATPTPSPQAARTTTASDPIRLRASYDASTGLWTASASIPAGTYLVWVEAVDAVGNRGASDPRPVQAVRIVPSVAGVGSTP